MIAKYIDKLGISRFVLREVAIECGQLIQHPRYQNTYFIVFKIYGYISVRIYIIYLHLIT